ncbi:MAG: thiamine phosphate synthase [Acetobacteraceae bacterium]|nr:thiamine phosphate synthase [Acetobacteraceae bacterium]
MPNLKPPVTTAAQASAYKQRILQAVPKGLSFEPLMTLYLTDNLPADEIARATERLMPIARDRNVAFLLNDNAALAAKLGCDGAHLGQGDGNHAAARRLLEGQILGITCHASRHLAMEAGELGADYVAFGAFFPTDSKQTIHRAGPEILAWWNEMFEIPSVAIGGITSDNCAPLVQAGADFLAVIGAVWNHPEGPAAGVQAMNAAIAAALAET